MAHMNWNPHFFLGHSLPPDEQVCKVETAEYNRVWCSNFHSNVHSFIVVYKVFIVVYEVL
jgi:hypothetical protein